MNIIDLVTSSRKLFFFFVDKCNENYRSGHDLRLYREIIGMHRKHCNLEDLLEKEGFIKLMYETLEKWNMNQKGARLIPFDDFKRSLRFWKDFLVRLYQYKLYEDNDNEIRAIYEMLEKVFINIKVMYSKRRIVGVSKSLHFLLPDLIMPIDGKYTLPAFYGYNKYSQSPEMEFINFKEIIETTFEIVHKLELIANDADGEQWNTSVPKLIDNAIIGFSQCKEEEVIAMFKKNG